MQDTVSYCPDASKKQSKKIQGNIWIDAPSLKSRNANEFQIENYSVLRLIANNL